MRRLAVVAVALLLIVSLTISVASLVTIVRLQGDVDRLKADVDRGLVDLDRRNDDLVELSSDAMFYARRADAQAELVRECLPKLGLILAHIAQVARGQVAFSEYGADDVPAACTEIGGE